jgi:hypothetical protein
MEKKQKHLKESAGWPVPDLRKSAIVDYPGEARIAGRKDVAVENGGHRVFAAQNRVSKSAYAAGRPKACA